MRYLVLGLLLTCLLCGVAATCLGVRCEYGCPWFSTYPEERSPRLSPTAALPQQGGSHYHHSLSLGLVTSQVCFQSAVTS